MITVSLFGSLASIVAIIAAHFIGDFAWQSTWMGMEKGKDWNALFAHCGTYTASFVLFTCLSVGFTMNTMAAVVIFTTHMIIDALKARYHVVKQIWQDQLLHAIVLAVLVVVGWIS